MQLDDLGEDAVRASEALRGPEALHLAPTEGSDGVPLVPHEEGAADKAIDVGACPLITRLRDGTPVTLREVDLTARLQAQLDAHASEVPSMSHLRTSWGPMNVPASSSQDAPRCANPGGGPNDSTLALRRTL